LTNLSNILWSKYAKCNHHTWWYDCGNNDSINSRARTKVFVLGLFVLFQVKSKSTSIQNIYLDLYLYFQKRTWYLYLYFRQILWYLYLSTKTCTFYFVLKIWSNIFFCNLNTFYLVEILAVFHNAGAGAIILRFDSYIGNRFYVYMWTEIMKKSLWRYIKSDGTFSRRTYRVTQTKKKRRLFYANVRKI